MSDPSKVDMGSLLMEDGTRTVSFNNYRMIHAHIPECAQALNIYKDTYNPILQDNVSITDVLYGTDKDITFIAPYKDLYILLTVSPSVKSYIFDGYIGNGVYINKPSTYMKPKYAFHYAVKVSKDIRLDSIDNKINVFFINTE